MNSVSVNKGGGAPAPPPLATENNRPYRAEAAVLSLAPGQDPPGCRPRVLARPAAPCAFSFPGVQGAPAALPGVCGTPLSGPGPCESLPLCPASLAGPSAWRLPAEWSRCGASARRPAGRFSPGREGARSRPAPTAGRENASAGAGRGARTLPLAPPWALELDIGCWAWGWDAKPRA